MLDEERIGNEAIFKVYADGRVLIKNLKYGDFIWLTKAQAIDLKRKL